MLEKLLTAPNLRCKGINRHGGPCGGFALNDSDYCFAHDPDSAKRRDKARKAGGKARQGRSLQLTWAGDEHRPNIHILSVEDVKALLERALLAEVTLENSHARNKVIGYLCGVALKALEVGEIEERIARLEESIVNST